MTKDEIIKLARKAGAAVGQVMPDGPEIIFPNCMDVHLFASLVAKQEREEDAKLVEGMTLEWPDQPEFAQVERTTIQDCAKIIRQRVVTYD